MTNTSSLFKTTAQIGLICLAGLLIVLGLFLCYTMDGNERFMVGVVIVAVGAVLLSIIKDMFKEVSA